VSYGFWQAECIEQLKIHRQDGCRDLESFKTWIQDGTVSFDSKKLEWDIAWIEERGHKGRRWYIVLKQGDSISVGYPVVTLARFYPFGLGKIKDMINRKSHDDKTKIKNAIKSAKAKKRKNSRSKVEWSQAVCFDHVHRSLD
jgi:hypothetical protein